VAYIYKINLILMRPMKSKSDESMVKAFTDIYAYLKTRNLQPKLHVLYNKCSKAVQTFMKNNGTDIHKIPRHHRLGAMVDINCPLQLWDLFLAQMQDTLTLLCTSRRYPSKSAYEEMEGEFGFTRTPISILGTKALVFVDPDERASWEAHGVDCYVYRLLHTKGVRKTGTYHLYPTNFKVPSMSDEDHTLLAAQQFLQVIKQNTSPDAADKLTHAYPIKALQSIITGTTPPRVDSAQLHRVSGSAALNPISTPTSNDPTAPRVIRATKQVY